MAIDSSQNSNLNSTSWGDRACDFINREFYKASVTTSNVWEDCKEFFNQLGEALHDAATAYLEFFFKNRFIIIPSLIGVCTIGSLIGLFPPALPVGLALIGGAVVVGCLMPLAALSVVALT